MSGLRKMASEILDIEKEIFAMNRRKARVYASMATKKERAALKTEVGIQRAERAGNRDARAEKAQTMAGYAAQDNNLKNGTEYCSRARARVRASTDHPGQAGGAS